MRRWARRSRTHRGRARARLTRSRRQCVGTHGAQACTCPTAWCRRWGAFARASRRLAPRRRLLTRNRSESSHTQIEACVRRVRGRGGGSVSRGGPRLREPGMAKGRRNARRGARARGVGVRAATSRRRGVCVGKGVHARARARERETHMSSVCTGCGLALWFGVAVLILRGCARVAALICDGSGSQNVRKGWREVPAPVRRAGCSNAHLGQTFPIAGRGARQRGGRDGQHPDGVSKGTHSRWSAPCPRVRALAWRACSGGCGGGRAPLGKLNAIRRS